MADNIDVTMETDADSASVVDDVRMETATTTDVSPDNFAADNKIKNEPNDLEPVDIEDALDVTVTKRHEPEAPRPPKEEIYTDESNKKDRIAMHSHLCAGLGLNKRGQAIYKCAGFVAQGAAREAAGCVVELIRQKKFSGRSVLLAGPPGSGKTAIALAMSRELGDRVPFVPMTASEVFSEEVKPSEIIIENFRRAIGVRIRETKVVYEGEVVKIDLHEGASVVAGATKTLTNVVVTLKTSKASKKLNLDPTIYEHFLKQRVERGDIIYIEANSGTVKRLGRCDHYASDYDLEADNFLPLPTGEVYKSREVVQDLTLHDMDIANARPIEKPGSSISSILSQMITPKKTEITERLRNEVNTVVDDLVEQGVATICPGVLFIDEVHVFDDDCFAFLNRALESPVAPIVVLATNRICDEDKHRVMGVPRDLADRVLVISTEFYNKTDIKEILSIRAEAEGVSLNEEALNELTELGDRHTLRYVVQLLLPVKMLAATAGCEIAEKRDVEEASSLFVAVLDKADLLQGLSDYAFDRDSISWELDQRGDHCCVQETQIDEGLQADLNRLESLTDSTFDD